MRTAQHVISKTTNVRNVIIIGIICVIHEAPNTYKTFLQAPTKPSIIKAPNHINKDPSTRHKYVTYESKYAVKNNVKHRYKSTTCLTRKLLPHTQKKQTLNTRKTHNPSATNPVVELHTERAQKGKKQNEN